MKANNNKYNLTIVKQSFELLCHKNKEKNNIGLNNNNIYNKKDDNNKENNIKNLTNEIRPVFSINKNNKFSSRDSIDSSSSSFSDNKNNKKINKSFSMEKPAKKIIHSSSSSSSSNKKKFNTNKGYKIYQNKGLKFQSKYFNINQITKGEFSKNVNFQNTIRNIILEKMPIFYRPKIEFSGIVSNLQRKVSNSVSPKKKIPKKFTGFPLSNLSNEKFKFSFRKNQRSNFMNSELNDKKRQSAAARKKINRKSNKNIILLNYINRNIKDDSDVLNNPDKFYNGLFNGLMKRYTKANAKPFQK